MSSSAQQLFYISTLFKTSGTNENFKYTMQIPDGMDRVVLLSASIPNTFYLVQEGLNTFTLRELATNYTVTVPPGNYSNKSFASVVAPLITAASGHGWTYSLSMANPLTEAVTGRFNFTVTGNGVNQPSFVFTNMVNEQLGFDINSTNSFVGNKLISSTTVNFGCESQIFLHSDIAEGDTSVLQEIYGNNTPFCGWMTYQCTAPDRYSKRLRSASSNTYNFSLTNEHDQLLNLHGVNMQLTLCIYKQDPINDQLRQYIKYKVQNEPQQ
jgi:hypothetical protein